jgi:dTDP-4-amino-4,6-dideoxygalactose transaminase
MIKDIGSFFWLNPVDIPLKHVGEWEMPDFYPYKSVIYSSSGRGALSLALKHINKRRAVVLIPIYTCESVLLPFIRENFKIIFYEINLDLTVNYDSLERQLEEYKPDLVFFQTYFGFDTLKGTRNLFKYLNENGILIIEDITHSFFSERNDQEADFYIASLRKWLAIPDGGLLYSPNRRIKISNNHFQEIIARRKADAMTLLYRYTITNDTNLKNKSRKVLLKFEQDLNSDYDFYPMSKISKDLFANTDIKYMSSTRRGNYAYLLDNLKTLLGVTPVFKSLPDKVVPLFMPVYVDFDRNAFQNYLASKRIYAPVHWPVPKEIVFPKNSCSSYIYNQILSIPCDQRYNLSDLERVVIAFSQFKKGQQYVNY